jgi:hypothetical protein
VVFSCPKPGRYFGFRLAGTAHKEGRTVGSWALLTRPTLAVPKDPLATHASRSHTNASGGTGVVPRTSRAPEGGGTTQRGDPAPGLM